MSSKNANKRSPINSRYRLVVMNDDTFQEVSSFVLSRVNIYLLLSSVLMIIIFGVTALIVFTPIKEYLPGLDRTELKYEVMKMEQDITLLEDSLNARQRYIQNIINVINGRHDTSAKTLSEQAPNYEIIDVSSTNSFDSVLREEIEKESEFSLFNKSESRDLESVLMHLFTPVKGVISKEYDKKGGHFGLDIVAPKNTTIMAALDGIVIFADWTLEDGYVLGIQHDNELISFYKHNSVLHKKIGNFVQAGEVVALIGNTGERTSGTHLHFELWYKGASIDPTDYLFLK